MDNISLVSQITESQDPLFGFQDSYDWLNSIVKEFEEKTGYKMNEAQQKILYSSLNYRIQKSYDKNFQGQIFNSINGIYEVLMTNGNKFFIHISSEPVHVLGRTTGRLGYSCEHIDNDASLGPFHDVALMNPTAYFVDEDGNWLGRLNIRWAMTPEGESVVGIDPNIYPHHQTYINRPNDEFKEALYYILKDYMQYDNAMTPYLYKGHSDTTSRYPDVALPYEGYEKLMKKLKPLNKKTPKSNSDWEEDWEWQMRFGMWAEEI